MYTNVNGNNANNFLNFVGISGLYSQTLVNPYTGFTITFNEIKNINNAIYDGMNGTDTLNMTIDGDVLTLLDADGTIMVKNVEIINASEGGDIINFAFSSISYGNLIMRGAGGDDILWGNNGNDTLLGAEGLDNIIGGGGNDFAFGGGNNDYLDGGAGTDYLAGGQGDDTLVYTADATWTGGLALSDLGSTVFFAAFVGLDGKNRSYDSFHGDTDDDGNVSSPGYDTLTMTAGDDVLLLADSFSPYIGPVGARVSYIDYINAGTGNDVVDLTGETTTSVTIDGGTGNDVLLATSLDDELNGGDDNDSLYGAGGDDTLNGGAGDDIYYYALGDGSDTIIESDGTDAIHFDEGITLDDLEFTIDNDNLLIKVGLGIITIQHHYAADFSGRVESLVFADGSTFDLTGQIINTPPVAQDDLIYGIRNQVVTGNVLADNFNGADADPDSDALTVVPATFTTSNGGMVELLADGSFTYTGAPGFLGTDIFDYTLLDGRGGEDTATVTLEVDYDPDAVVGTEDDDLNLIGTQGDDEMFGLGGNDTLYGDDGILGGGGTQDKVFADSIIIPDMKERVNIAKLNPSGVPALGIAEGNLSVNYDATATITFRQGYAGYNNSLGAFTIADDGSIVDSKMYWANVKTAGIDVAHTIDLPTGATGGNYGFFLIADGDNANKGYAGMDITGEGHIQFIYNYGKTDARTAKITDAGAKISAVYTDGVTTKVLKGNVFFTTDRGDDPIINKDGKVHAVSGLIDTNNLSLDMVKADLVAKPTSFTKNGITISTAVGNLVEAGDRIGIKSTSKDKNTVDADEVLAISFAHAAEKVMIALSDIAGGNTAVDVRVYIEGSTIPVTYESLIGAGPGGGKISGFINAADVGGLITKIELYSTANSSAGVETFYLDNVKAYIPGGVDTDIIRIGFEDLLNTGDADYEDVVFDLNINPVGTTETGGNDILDGGAGNDTLYGEGGNDILVIGDGADRAFGGDGADIFALTLVDGDVDRIEDFKAVDGDTINIADVLEGFDPLADNINDFVQLVQNGADTEIRINADGDVGGAYDVAALVLGTHVDIASIVADQSALA